MRQAFSAQDCCFFLLAGDVRNFKPVPTVSASSGRREHGQGHTVPAARHAKRGGRFRDTQARRLDALTQNDASGMRWIFHGHGLVPFSGNRHNQRPSRRHQNGKSPASRPEQSRPKSLSSGSERMQPEPRQVHVGNDRGGVEVARISRSLPACSGFTPLGSSCSKSRFSPRWRIVFIIPYRNPPRGACQLLC